MIIWGPNPGRFLRVYLGSNKGEIVLDKNGEKRERMGAI